MSPPKDSTVLHKKGRILLAIEALNKGWGAVPLAYMFLAYRLAFSTLLLYAA
ncbi:hypothetical protein ACJ73_10380 [Blastomyces percursus]|uniref:MFS transporter n=1 Tax=Blastomyces percursus TaxID=1658174 RepID=A0A1J9NZ17_9EURO|nr:hypothetical protein ACJ73_10380 [Blastomyces percursus]